MWLTETLFKKSVATFRNYSVFNLPPNAQARNLVVLELSLSSPSPAPSCQSPEEVSSVS